jgi:hypothetical protein
MNRRKFLSLVSGAVAAVAGGLGLVKAKPVAPMSFKGVPLHWVPPLEQEATTSTVYQTKDGPAFIVGYDGGSWRWKTLAEITAAREKHMRETADAMEAALWSQPWNLV